MGNWKSRSDDQIWWESQPGNRGRTYPGDDIASKQYERNKAAGENNLSIAKGLWNRMTQSRPKDYFSSMKDLDPSLIKRDVNGQIMLSEPKDRFASGIADQQRRDLMGRVNRGEMTADEAFGPTETSHINDQRITSEKRGGKVGKYAKGGAISLKDCKVSTHEKNKKHKDW
jgi:hypothetical protein